MRTMMIVKMLVLGSNDGDGDVVGSDNKDNDVMIMRTKSGKN
jgi:hypothetical protein